MPESMIDMRKLQEAPRTAIDQGPQATPAHAAMLAIAMLQGLSVAQLLEVRQAVHEALPPLSLANVNLEEECMAMFRSTRELLNMVLLDDVTPVNQKAQVANSCSSNLAQLVKLQLDLYNSERVKALEHAIKETLKTLPTESQLKFFDEYEQTYGRTCQPQSLRLDSSDARHDK